MSYSYSGYSSRYQSNSFVEQPSKSFANGTSFGEPIQTEFGFLPPGRAGTVDPTNALFRETASSIAKLPLDLRFAKLHQILTNFDARELQEIYPACVEAVFGFQTAKKPDQTSQWNSASPFIPSPFIPPSFCEINLDFRLVFEAGLNLLHPDGPLFRFIASLAYNRNSQQAPRFSFPVACLPCSVQQNLENGFVSPYFRDKINVDFSETEGLPVFVSLTALDFYFCHFAYHLVNPDLRTNTACEPDCLYMTLIDVYSDCFFNPRAILENQNVTSYGISHKRPSSSGFPKRFAPENGFPNETIDPPFKFSPLATSETLESIVNIFVEFWLNMSGFSSVRSSRKYPRRSSGSERGRTSPPPGRTPLGGRRKVGPSPNAPTVFPPTSALQAFRQVIKALHEFIFAQSAESRGLRKNVETSLLEMKRHIIPQLIQRPLYDLLKDSNKKYPMDASFRFVYELWLTYIQPWRYETALDNSKTDEVIVVSQDPRWLNFMTDNLLFYTALFQGFLDRMMRVDFSVPFNTLAVFRVAKVYHETGIFKRVVAIESAFASTKSTTSQGGYSPAKSQLRNHFADLEGQSFIYVSIRSPDNVAKVLELLRILEREKQRCQRTLTQTDSPSTKPDLSLDYFKTATFDVLKCIFGLVTGPIVGMQLHPVELEKMVRNISKAMECLTGMYEIEQQDLFEEYDTPSESFILDRDSSAIVPATVSANLSHSRSNRRNSTAWIDEEKVSYLSPPESRAARSWEVKGLILLLNELSNHINQAYGDDIVRLYNGQDFLARLIHPLIEPPHTPSGMPRGARPPRINLRPLASKYKLYGLLFVIFFMWMVDFGFFRGVFWLFAIPTFFLIANAILEPFRSHDK